MSSAESLQGQLGSKQFADNSDNNEDDQTNSIDVDSNTYLVGPGDGFQIHVKELPSQGFKTTINSNGNIFIGEFGEIPIGKLPLIQAYQVIRQRVKASLKKESQVYVTLIQLKNPDVSVIGPVSSPGTLQMKGKDRVLDAIKAANRGKMPDSTADLREIRIRNGDSLKILDLMLFLENE